LPFSKGSQNLGFSCSHIITNYTSIKKKTLSQYTMQSYDGDQDQDEMEANNQGQEEVEAQVLDAQGVISPPHRLTRSEFKALGNSGRLFSLFIVSCVIKGA